MSFARLACFLTFTVVNVFAGYLPGGGFGGFGGHGVGGIGGVGGFGGFGGAAPLHAPCASSVQCTGVAVCVQQQCECPAPLYRAVGGACQVVTYNTFHTVPAVKTSVIYAYPGNPCGPALSCVGGSSCLSGVCGCSPGFVVSGPSCVVGGPALPAFPAPLAPGGFGGFGGFGGHFGGFGGPLPGPGPVAPIAPAFPGPVGFGGHFGGCGGPCSGGMVCVANACQCPSGYVASAGMCGPLVPVVQVGPGGPCAAGQECTGGSVCNGGICCCPDGLVQIGAVCVLPPPPPPPPQVFIQQTVTMIAPGNPCMAHTQCVVGASCLLGTCRCGGSYMAAGPSCVRKCSVITTLRSTNGIMYIISCLPCCLETTYHKLKACIRLCSAN